MIGGAARAGKSSNQELASTARVIALDVGEVQEVDVIGEDKVGIK